jgi:hypothetical protein
MVGEVLQDNAVFEEVVSGPVGGWWRLPLVGRPRRNGNMAHSQRLSLSLRDDLPLEDSMLGNAWRRTR